MRLPRWVTFVRRGSINVSGIEAGGVTLWFQAEELGECLDYVCEDNSRVGCFPVPADYEAFKELSGVREGTPVVGRGVVVTGGVLMMISTRGSFVAKTLKGGRYSITAGIVTRRVESKGCSSIVFAESARSRGCLGARRKGGLPMARYVGKAGK